MAPDGAAKIIIFLPPYAATGIRTHVTSVSRAAPTRDLLKDALLIELPRRGFSLLLEVFLVPSWFLGFRKFFVTIL